ncbi:MAG: hypothetical protein AAGC85_22305, partial [Bacteroidota bacterium]
MSTGNMFNVLGNSTELLLPLVKHGFVGLSRIVANTAILSLFLFLAFLGLRALDILIPVWVI